MMSFLLITIMDKFLGLNDRRSETPISDVSGSETSGSPSKTKRKNKDKSTPAVKKSKTAAAPKEQ